MKKITLTLISIGAIFTGCRNDNKGSYEYAVYGADIYYIDGNRLFTERGTIDSTFANKSQLAAYLEDLSANDMRELLFDCQDND